MTSTVMVRTTASFGMPTTVQTTAVRMAAPRVNQNNHAAALSARRCARDDDSCASVTSF